MFPTPGLRKNAFLLNLAVEASQGGFKRFILANFDFRQQGSPPSRPVSEMCGHKAWRQSPEEPRISRTYAVIIVQAFLCVKLWPAVLLPDGRRRS